LCAAALPDDPGGEAGALPPVIRGQLRERLRKGCSDQILHGFLKLGGLEDPLFRLVQIDILCLAVEGPSDVVGVSPEEFLSR
jgi:hypothetical protein